MIKKIIFLVIILSLGLGLSLIKAEEEKRIEKITKQITGEVSGISKNFIAVEYGLDEKEGAILEMAFNLDKETKIERKNDLSEINLRDTVNVIYEEVAEVDKEGNKRIIEYKPKIITFIKPAPKVLEGTGLVSEPEEVLPIKGIKEGVE